MKLLLFSLCLLLCCKMHAQQNLPLTKKMGTLSGNLKQQNTHAPMPYVTFTIQDSTGKMIAGGITNENGDFITYDVPLGGKYLLTCSFMGYRPITKLFTISSISSRLDIGTLMLEEDPKQLKEVTVAGEKSTINLQLDKKVFEVGKDILSQNGAVNDLLNNVPSVTVSPTGSVSLRGNNNVIVLINGRRSGLTQTNALDQIPADQVERIEIVTNPSANYDASGTAGIINIVLKKNKKGGFTGQVRLQAGSPNDSRIAPSLNFKSNKLNIFSTLGWRYSDYVGDYLSNQTINNKGVNTYMNYRSGEKRHDDGQMIYTGADYYLNDKHTFTVAYLKNATKDHDKTNAQYDFLNTHLTNDCTIKRWGESWEKRDYNQLEFNFTKLFTQPGRKWTVDMQYDFWNSNKKWVLETGMIAPVITPQSAIRTFSSGNSRDFLLQTDYIHPIAKNSKLTLGAKVEHRVVNSDYKAEEKSGNEWETYDNIDNKLSYKEFISSAYAQFNQQYKHWSYLVGLRVEQSNINIADRVKSFNSTKNYGRLFPSVHINYEIKTGSAFQLSYSKRINRPSLWLLYPFNELTDLNAQYVGNPGLNPSFGHVFELGFLRNWKKVTFNPSIYYQNTLSPIQDYTYRNEQEVFITTPINIHRETRTGFELSINYSPIKVLQLNTELNIYTFSQAGKYEQQDFDFNGHILTGRASAQWKLPAKFAFQARYNYSGPRQNAQSKNRTMQWLDMGISKNMWKDKLTIVIDVTNLFNTRQTRTTVTGTNYTFYQMSNPNAARYRVSVAYKFKGQDAPRQAQSGNRN
ncbi:outer membrane receptor protein involved in Fe transport [Chitinophaga skermanii]|uniref:Outer membrane receptor protein involved in Fe transport n=1 Tax=Chitinophaga skermanii TaxID=331697 RepID=A0A327QEA0_9BACT|nr:outer membrane beta-barrel family protein [Chitinophaga skermanii]RAJ02335.1 outer membrane receptor protein involved in Fe transport [Chitinophaga skermanii]